ncbi:MAG: 50S ribosomal protein L17 [Deltaproteobacteria bacterium]|nr:50S ribosomal protein L17 [Deltaproteobacteria bacterium]
MRHQKAGRRLSRTTEHRTAMLRNLITSLLEHERVETTRAKAKEARQWAEQIISLAKRGDLHARRQALAVVRSKKVVAKLFGDLRERFLERPGGYTRIVPLGIRVGDGAPMSILELVGRPEKLPKAKKKKAPGGVK